MPVPYFGGRQVASRLGRGLARRAAKKFVRSAMTWSAREAARLSRSTYRPVGVVTRNRFRGIKQTVMRMKETHFVDFNYGKTELYHNVFSNCILHLNGTLQLPAQGDGDSNRTGNDIYSRGVQIKLMLGKKLDRHNVTFRVMVVRATKGYAMSPYSQIFDNQTGNIMLDAVDKDRVSVLYDKKHSQKVDVNQHNADKEITFFRKIYIPHKTLYKFYDDSAQSNSYPYDIHLIVMAYDAYGTLTTDNVTYCQVWSRFYFKDK